MKRTLALFLTLLAASLVATASEVSKTFTLNVKHAPPTLAAITPDNGAQGATVNVTLTGTNFRGPVSFSFEGAPWASVSAITLVSSTSITAVFAIDPAAPVGAHNLAVLVGTPGVPSNALPFNVASSLAITTSSPLPDAVAGQFYTVTFQAVGGVPPYTWSHDTGAYPPGLTFNVNTGVLSGTIDPSAAGQTYTFTMDVTDSSSP